MNLSLTVQSSPVTHLEASPCAAGPSKVNCIQQIAKTHPLANSQANYAEHMFNLNMQMVRNREGMGAPLRHCMDLYAARKIGRLPFLESSHLMEDVLLGRDSSIDFADFLNMPGDSEFLRQPHMVMERSLGIL